MADPRDTPSLPGIQLLHLVELVQRWQVDPEEFLEGTGLDREQLADPRLRLSMATYEALIDRARKMTGEPGIGLYYGLQMRLSSHGNLGFVAMTAARAGEALELAARFTPTRTTAIALRVHREGEMASLVIEEKQPLGTAQDAILFALVAGIYEIGKAVTGQELTGTAEFAFAEPRYFERFAHLFPGEVRFDRPIHQIIFPASFLDLPLTMSDPAALRIAREHCEKELAALGFAGDVVPRVRSLLAREDGGYRTIEEVADRLHVSVRTLKRKLAAQGTSFSEVLDEMRCEKALLLLRSPELSIAEVADRLGYSDATGFTRAFRRWTGVTPAAFRRGPSVTDLDDEEDSAGG